MEIKLSREEADLLEAMSEEDKEKFYANAEKVRTNLGLKTVALTTMIIENLDQLEQFNMKRGKLKETAKAFNIQMHKYMKEVYDNIEGDAVFSSDFIVELTTKIDELM